MDSKRRWVWTALAGGILCAGVFVISPWWSVASLAKALQAQDQQRVALYVDFPRVRESIAQQLKADIAESIEAEADDDPYAGLGAVLGAVVVDRAVDAFATPEGLAKVMRKSLEDHGATAAKSATRLETMQQLQDRVDLEWLTLREIRATVRDEKRSEPVSALLERDGLRWRVVDLEIPDLDL